MLFCNKISENYKNHKKDTKYIKKKMQNEVIQDESGIYTLEDSAMPSVIESFSTFGLVDTPQQKGDLGMAKVNDCLIVRQLGEDTLRVRMTAIEDIKVSDNVQIIGKIEIYEKGNL